MEYTLKFLIFKCWFLLICPLQLRKKATVFPRTHRTKVKKFREIDRQEKTKSTTKQTAQDKVNKLWEMDVASSLRGKSAGLKNKTVYSVCYTYFPAKSSRVAGLVESPSNAVNDLTRGAFWVLLEFHKAIMIKPSPHKMQMKSERHYKYGFGMKSARLAGWLVGCCLIDFICPPAPEEAGGTKERSW
jgi:hypothetical protein